MFGVPVSDIQSGVNVGNGEISGVLNYLSDPSLSLVHDWGPGNFLALKFESDVEYDSIKVGLNPSEGSGMVTLDSDMNGVFKITDNLAQEFVIIGTDSNGQKTIKRYDLSGLECRKA